MDGCVITDSSTFCSVLLYVDTRLRFSAYRPGSLGRLETQNLSYQCNDPSDCLMSHGWPLCFFGCAVGTAAQSGGCGGEKLKQEAPLVSL